MLFNLLVKEDYPKQQEYGWWVVGGQLISLRLCENNMLEAHATLVCSSPKHPCSFVFPILFLFLFGSSLCSCLIC